MCPAGAPAISTPPAVSAWEAIAAASAPPPLKSIKERREEEKRDREEKRKQRKQLSPGEETEAADPLASLPSKSSVSTQDKSQVVEDLNVLDSYIAQNKVGSRACPY